jgi:cell division protein ZapA
VASADKEIFDVTIGGVPLRLKSSHSAQMVQDLVQTVDSKIQEALKVTKTGSIQNAAILAALNLAEELLQIKNQTDRQLERLEHLTIQTLNELELSPSASDATF